MRTTSMRAPPQPLPVLAGVLKIALALIAVAGLIVAGRSLPVADWIQTFNLWVGGLGPAGAILFVAVYVIATVLFLPGSALTLGAGFAFGVGMGFAVVSIGSTLGAAASFLVSRRLARDLATRRLAGNAHFQAVDSVMARHGARIVFMLRLTPMVPFNVLNYLLGVTSVRFWPCAFASWAGMIPGSLLYVYLGHVGRAGIDAATAETSFVQTLRFAYIGVGLLTTLAVATYVTRLARGELRRTGSVELKDGAGH